MRTSCCNSGVVWPEEAEALLRAHGVLAHDRVAGRSSARAREIAASHRFEYGGWILRSPALFAPPRDGDLDDR